MKQNLVIDLDETLIHTFRNRETFDSYQPQYGEIKYNLDDIFGVKRPNVDSFLAWCAGNYENIGVWSAGEYEYVNIIVDLLFTGRKPTFIWSWDDCDIYHDKSGNVIYNKPLEFVYDLYPEFTPLNTIFIDDASHSNICNAGNMITIKHYNPEIDGCIPDSHLLTVKSIMKKMKNSIDVRTNIINIDNNTDRHKHK